MQVSSMRPIPKVIVAVTVLVVAMLLAACTDGVRPIVFGRAECDYCRMRIDDPRFGGEIVTTHGRVRQFDAVECTASYYRTLPRDAKATAWVIDFEHPGRLIPAATAHFLQASGGEHVGTPMGRGLVAVAPTADVSTLRRQLGATRVMTWDDVLASSETTGARPARPARPASATGPISTDEGV